MCVLVKTALNPYKIRKKQLFEKFKNSLKIDENSKKNQKFKNHNESLIDKCMFFYDISFNLSIKKLEMML